MKTNAFTFKCLLIFSLLAGPNLGEANGDDRFFVGGNADWVEGLGFGNWTPLNDEPDPDDTAIFNTDNNVDLGSNNEVEGLTLSNSIDLSTSTFFLDVNGDINLSGSGTVFGVGGNDVTGVPTNGLDAENITVGNGSRLSLGDSRIDWADPGAANVGLLDIQSGGTVSGNGTLRNNDNNYTTPTVVLRNNGTLSAANFNTGVIIVGTPSVETLTITDEDTDARIDLDGRTLSFPTSIENGVVNVFRNQTLDIDVQLSDTFNSDINLFQESRLDIEDAWALGNGGLINVDNGFVPSIFPFPSTPAGNATIAGGTLTQSGGTIDLVDGDGTLTFEANYTANGGTLDNSSDGTVVFQGTTTLIDGHTYTQGANSQTIVDGGITVINDDGLVLDGTSNSDWTVTNNGRLNVRSATLNGAGSNVFSGDLVFDRGVVDVNVDGTSWTSNNEIRSESGGTLIGDRVLVGNDIGGASADIDVNGGTLVIEAPVSLLSDANVNVAAGSTLIINSPNTIVAPVNGANSGVFTGSGDLFIRGAQFDEATTLNFSGGTVGLDGFVGNNSTVIALGSPAADTDVNADLTINAATFDPYGTTSFAIFPLPATQSDLNIANAATLTINLDNPDGAWDVLSNGIINYSGNAGANTFLAGSDINMNGTLNVTGDGRVTARMDIGGTININTAAESLRLNSGGDTHTLAGGTINGPGTLLAESDDSLSGNGVINANVDFNNASDLIASGGLLDVNGTIVDVGTLRSNGAGAVLDLQNTFNSSTTNNGISLLGGGRIQGNTITLSDRDLRGAGTVLNQVINDNTIAAQGGTLTLDNVNSDYDGTTNNGILRAQTGTLTVRDIGTVGFQGTVRVESERLFFAEGFELQMNGGSLLDLNNGTFRSDAGNQDFFGAIDVAAGVASIIDTPNARIRETATVQLDGDLHIFENSDIRDGASFTGSGRVVNLNSTNIMTLSNNADVDVLLENRGFLNLDNDIGRADVADYLQTSSASILFDLETTTLGDYDRLIVSGNADLAGEISIEKIGAGTFDAYDTISVLTASAGVSGTFDTVAGITDGLPLGQGFAVTYDPDSVNITGALLGDANLDMTVDVLNDGFTLVGNLGVTSGATWADGDFTGDGEVDVLGDAFALVGNLNTTFGASSSSFCQPMRFPNQEV